MASCKIQAPSCNHLVMKFSANEPLHTRKSAENFPIRELDGTAFTQCGNPFYVSDEIRGNQSLRTSLGSSKVSYSCTENMKPVITAYNKKLLFENINTVPPWNYRIENKCQLTRKCRIRNF